MPRFSRLSPTVWATLQVVFEQAFSLLLLAVQAPMLGPRPFGLIAIAMVITGFCEFVLCTVIAEALISLREIEELHFRTMMTLGLIVALILGFVIFAGAEILGLVFGDPELAHVLRWMAILPVISSFSAVPTAFAKRDMQFRPLALRSFVSLTAGGIVGLTLTLAGSGVEALIWQALVLRATAAIVLWWRVPVSFRFALSPRHAAELGRFAYKLMISRVMNWASGQVSRFILGLYLGPADLGMFSMATRLNGVVVQVALEPKVSVARIYLRRFLAAREGLEHAAHRLFQQVSIFSFPFFIGGAAVIPTLFHAWLGPQWSGGILPTQLMFLMGVPLVTFYCATALLLALNHQAAEAWISTLQTASVIIVVLAVAPFGIAAAAAALCLRQWALLPLPLVLIRRYCGVSVGTVLLAQLPALTAASLSGAVVHLLDSRLSESFGSLTSLLILIAVGAALYALLIGLMLPRLFVDVVGHLTRRLSRAP